MDEYIEREAAIEAAKHAWAKGLEPSQYIEIIPSTDVAPVRHGQWNADETCPFCGEKSTEGLDAEKWNYWFPEFCPNCGAKMDLED